MADVNIRVRVIDNAAKASVTRLGKEAQKTEKSFEGLNISVRQTTSAFKVFLGNIAATAVTNFTSALGGLASAALESTTSLETITSQFETLTGSTEAADKAIRDVQAFAARTPFSFEGVAQATQRLLSFGFTAEESLDRLQDLGDVAAASGADVNELALIFGQVSAAGKLTGERLLQFQERAIPIGPALAKTLGVAESSVRDLVSSGEVSFAQFEKAFQSLNEEGEFAFGGLERRSATLEGRISNLEDDFTSFSASIGSQFAPAAKAILGALSELIQQLQNDRAFAGFITQVADNIPTAINLAAGVFTAFIDIFAFLGKAAGVVTAGFAAVAAGAIDIAVAALQAEIALKEFAGFNTSDLEDSVVALQAAKAGFEDLGVGALEVSDQVTNAQTTINTAVENGVDLVNTKIQEEISTQRERGTAATVAAKEIVAAEEKKATLVDLFAERDVLREEEKRNRLLAVQELKDNEEFALLEAKLGKEEAANFAAEARRLQQAGKTEQAIQTLRDAAIAAEKADAAKKEEIRKQEIQDEKAFFNATATLARSGNKTLAAIGKAQAITQIAIKTPEAIASSFAFGARIGGPPLGFVFGGIAAAAMAVQAAQVAGIGFQEGGIVPGSNFSGDRVAARVNSGEMILNRQQQAELFAMANGAGGGGREIVVNTTVELDGEAIGKSVSRQVADGLELGEVV